MIKTLIRMGNIFEGGADITVLPCSAKGTVTSSTRTWQELFDLPEPRQVGHLRLGDVTALIASPKAKKKTQYIVYAASVLNDASSPEAIFTIGRHLGSITRSRKDLRIVEAPLLGGGHGGLDAVVAAQALCNGFRSSAAHDATLHLFVYDAHRLRILHETLGADYSGRSPHSGASADSSAMVLCTFLFSDIVSSTAIRATYRRRFGDAAGDHRYRQEVLEPHDRRITELFRSHDGEVVDGKGDSYLAAFHDARNAIECAVAIQESLTKDPIEIRGIGKKLPRRVQIRIGMHTGGAQHADRAGRPTYDGHTLNIASRIQGYAGPDQIVTSVATWRSAGEIKGLKSKRCSDTLKGLPGKSPMVEVLWSGQQPQVPEQSVARKRRQAQESRMAKTKLVSPTATVVTAVLKELRAITANPRILRAAKAVMVDSDFPRRMVLSSSVRTVHNPVWDHIDVSEIGAHGAKRDQPRKIHYCDIFLVCRKAIGSEPTLYTWFSAGWQAHFLPYAIRNASKSDDLARRATSVFRSYVEPLASRLTVRTTGDFAVSVKRNERDPEDWWLYVFELHSVVLPKGCVPRAADVKWLSLSHMDAAGTPERRVNGDVLTALRVLFTADLSGLRPSAGL